MKIAPVFLVMLLLCGSNAFSAIKLSANPTSLDFWGTTISPSPSKSYVLAMNGPGTLHIRVTASAHTEVSEDNASFGSTVPVFALSNGTTKTIYVRVVTANAILLNETITNIDIDNSNQTAPVSVTGDVPLPITLSSFKLNLLAETPVLTWTTISEIDNYGFYVQKSQDNVTWTDILTSFQKGYGTTIETHSYSFTDNTLPVGNYYRLHQVDLNGTNHYSDAASVVASVQPETAVREFALNQNYPNPFNPTTGVRFSVPTQSGRDLVSTSGRDGRVPGVSDVKLTVYDLLGKEVAVLVNERKMPGNYEVQFDAGALASGVYIYRLTAGTFTDTKRMVLMK
jgi:hypothetical protein